MATLYLEHPVEGVMSLEVEEYRTRRNGTLVATEPDGGQWILSGEATWLVYDEEVGDG